MRSHFTLEEAKSALRSGRQIEQLLGVFQSKGAPAIRYVTVYLKDEIITANVYERLVPPDGDLFDVDELPSVDEDSDGVDRRFESLEKAISDLKYRNGASEDRFVNRGMLYEEYKDFAQSLAKHPLNQASVRTNNPKTRLGQSTPATGHRDERRW